MLGSFELLEQVINSVFGEDFVLFSDHAFIPDTSMKYSSFVMPSGV